MCQEAAHTFGLDHQSNDVSSQNSCMDYFANIGTNAGSTLSTLPNQNGFDELNLIYGHLDGTSTVASITAATFARSVAGSVSMKVLLPVATTATTIDLCSIPRH